MFCPNCGSEIPDGSASCSVCNASLMEQTAQNVAYEATSVEMPAKKNKTVPVLIGAAVIVVAVIAVLFLTGVIGGGKYNGTYDLDSAEAYGFVIEAEDFETYGMSYDDIGFAGLQVRGNSCWFVDEDGKKVEDSGSAKIEIDGSKVVITDGSQKITGTYKDGVISLEESGATMNFKK